jgi:outer membrane immunogenic protein
MKLATVFLSTTAILVATSALAADLPTMKAPPAPMPTLAVAPYSWTGFHIGIGGGLAALQVKSSSDSYLNDYVNGVYSYGGERSDLGKFGAFGTIEVGGDYQMDRFVVGAFGDFNFGDLKAGGKSAAPAYCHTNINNNCTTTAIHSVWYKVNNSWDAGVRLGYLLNDRNLVYALGGYTSADIKSGARLDQYVNGNAAPYQYVYSSQSGWKSGWLIGAGWETALTDHITFKAEYRYADYGTVSSIYQYNNGPYNGGARSSGQIAVQSVRAALSYKF